MGQQNVSVEEDTIQEYVRLSQQGDDRSFGQIYDLYAGPLFKFIYIRVRHQQTAEDLLSLTFLKVWQKIAMYQIRSNAKFSTWLFQISHNVIRDYWRKNKVEQVLDEHHQYDVIEHETTDEKIDYKMTYSLSMQALATLSPRYQTIITLRFINQLSIEESAQVMNKSNGAIRVLQSRALKALRKKIT